MKIIYTINNEEIYVDDEDYDMLLNTKWRLNEGGYVYGYMDGKSNFMHRIITKCPKGLVVDHIDHNPKNNQKENLRICTRNENMRYRFSFDTYANKKTSSKFKGVSWSKDAWRVQLQFEDKNMELGLFKNEICAANCYNYYAKKYFGDFAILNDVEYLSKEEWSYDRYVPKFYSRYYGVTYNKKTEKWIARIWLNKRNQTIGDFDDEWEAAQAYNEYVLKYRNGKGKINTKDTNKMVI
jgi:hypothetical protein